MPEFAVRDPQMPLDHALLDQPHDRLREAQFLDGCEERAFRDERVESLPVQASQLGSDQVRAHPRALPNYGYQFQRPPRRFRRADFVLARADAGESGEISFSVFVSLIPRVRRNPCFDDKLLP